MLMILQKVRLLEPVVIMGETGTGKTYLVKYMTEVVFAGQSEFFPFIFYYGVEESKFVKFMENVIRQAKLDKKKMFWIFFDEFNTSSLQPHVVELMNDRIFSLSADPSSNRIYITQTFHPKNINIIDFRVPDNLLFIAACNPFQMKSIGENKRNDIIFTHPKKENFLSHKVLPISYSLLVKLHDYGSLNEEVEKNYIRNMLSNIFCRIPNWVLFVRKQSNWYMRSLIDISFESQLFLKKINNNDSSMSLRDIHRVKLIFEFYYLLLSYAKAFQINKISFNDFVTTFFSGNYLVNNEFYLISMCMSIQLNYINRIGLIGIRLNQISLTHRQKARNHWKNK